MYPRTYADLFRSFERKPIVFVGMPFSKEFDVRWRQVFKPAIQSCNLKPYRLKERVVSESIPVDILEGIGRSKFLLFDVSDDEGGRPNPNVMYELGVAHAMRLPEEVIVVKDEEVEAVPFDIRHIRWNGFRPRRIKESVGRIKSLIRGAESEVDLTKDMLVQQVLRSLDIDMAFFLDTIRHWRTSGFDLCAFDPDRKGNYGLVHKDCSEEYLRQIARELIRMGVITAAAPIAPQQRVYGVTAEYYVTQLGNVLLDKISDFAKAKPWWERETVRSRKHK